MVVSGAVAADRGADRGAGQYRRLRLLPTGSDLPETRFRHQAGHALPQVGVTSNPGRGYFQPRQGLLPIQAGLNPEIF